MMTIFTVEILCIGNELLSGITINTNAHWISRKITQVGGFVKRITVVRDDVDEISLVLKECLVRKPNWIIISGGLGPTYDDKTLQGVAIGLGVDLVLDKTAVEMLRNSYARHSINYDLNGIRLKMAKIPMGSLPIQNPVGNAPSVFIESVETKIVCLPGVPIEMKAIFLENILPQIRKMIGNFYIAERNYEIIGISEAMLAPVLLNVVESNHPDSIYLKTHPQGYGNDGPKLRVQIVSKGKNRSDVQKRLDNISSALIEEIHKLDGKIL